MLSAICRELERLFLLMLRAARLLIASKGLNVAVGLTITGTRGLRVRT